MMSKEIIEKNKMYEHIKKGVGQVADIVSRTLGPGGLPILIQRVGQTTNGDPLGPMATKDGVTVAGECASPETEVDVVIQAVKDICRQTNKVVGDGTTSSIVLGNAILTEYIMVLEKNQRERNSFMNRLLRKNVQEINPQQVKLELEEAMEKVIAIIQQEVTPCKDYDTIEHVATISANGDKSIGNIIRRAFNAVGTEGVITVDEGGGAEHSLDIVEGYQIRRGAEAQDRFFNNTDGTKFEAQDCYVLMFDGKLTSAQQITSTLEILWQKHNSKIPPVLFMASEYSQEVLQALLIYKAEHQWSFCAIKNPHQTKVTTAMLDDMAVFLGGTRLGNGSRALNNMTINDFGIAKRVVVDKYTTTYFGGAGKEEDVMKRIEQLKVQRGQAESPYDAALISDRIASLSEGIAKIGVGGLTDIEVKEKYHRIEDAVNAVRAAIEEGVVPGGGATLYRASEGLTEDTIGERVLKNALKAPFRTIMSNLGHNKLIQGHYGSMLVNMPDMTYNGVSGKMVNALDSGIVDPLKVVKTALKNAISIAGLLATCGGAIIYKDSEKK